MAEEELQSEEYLAKCADCLLEAQKIREDEKLMAKVKPVLEEKVRAMKKFLDFEDLRKIANKKAQVEYDEAQKKQEDYFAQKVLGWNDGKSSDTAKKPAGENQ